MFGGRPMDQPTFAELESEQGARPVGRYSLSHGLIPGNGSKSASARSIPRRAVAGAPILRCCGYTVADSTTSAGSRWKDMLEVESVTRRLSGPLPDETTILNFRHLPELGLCSRTTVIGVGHSGVVDASMRRRRNRESETLTMRQTKKGNEWHFGMKVHIGAAETVVHRNDTCAFMT